MRTKHDRKRVLIIADSCTMQALLEQTLSVRMGYDIVGIAADGTSAIPLIHKQRPDLVIIDLAMPYINGQPILKAMDCFPEVYKIVISSTAFDNLSIKASLERMGADACLSREEAFRDPAEFCRVLTAIVRTPKKVPAKPSSSAPTAPARALELPVPNYPIPCDERERLRELSRLGVANDVASHRLDLLTEHLAKTTRFSACVMTFIDRTTQWIKSGHGLDRGSNPRAQAICNYTICGDETFIVDDTLADARFCRLDEVRGGAMIRSYVGHPIIGSTNVRLGAICLLDTRPRSVTLPELVNLRSIARIAGNMIDDCGTSIDRAA